MSRQAREFLARDHGLYINGAWVKARDGEAIEVEDPSTGTAIATVAGAGPKDVDEAVAAARAAFESGPWPAMSPSARSELLWKLADVLEAHRALLTELEVLDTGMPLTAAGAHAVSGAARMLRYYAGWPSKIAGQTVGSDPRPGAAYPPLTYTRREPVGVVGQIIPWNYPLGMLAMKLGPALATGCTVVLKPDEKTPLSSLCVAGLLAEAGVPAGVVNIVPGFGHRAGAALTAHAGVDKVAFTGSVDVARRIIAAAKGNLKRVSLELGGKAPFIIFPDADLDAAIAAAARLAFFLQGQNCQAASRLMVHESITERVTAGVIAAARAMKIGAALDPATEIGPLVSAGHLDRVQAYVAGGVAEGARLAVGGRRLDRPGYFMEPTVFTGVEPGMRIVQEEIFGPVTCIETFGDEGMEEIARRANDTIYGLIASVWTRDLHKAHRLAELIRAGVVGINQHGGGNLYAPFGGFKQSGWGREFGAESLDAYLETKTVMVRYD